MLTMFERSQRVIIIVDACIAAWSRKSKNSINVMIKRSKKMYVFICSSFVCFFESIDQKVNWCQWTCEIDVDERAKSMSIDQKVSWCQSTCRLMSMNVWNWCRWTCEIDVDWSKNQLKSIDVSIELFIEKTIKTSLRIWKYNTKTSNHEND